MAKEKRGMRRGLTAYGDEDFSLFLRTAFIKAMGYSDDALDRPIVGITNTFSGFNACHRNVPELIEAVADHICETLFLADERVLRVEVKIVKLAIAEAGESIGVTLVRHRR